MPPPRSFQGVGGVERERCAWPVYGFRPDFSPVGFFLGRHRSPFFHAPRSRLGAAPPPFCIERRGFLEMSPVTDRPDPDPAGDAMQPSPV